MATKSILKNITIRNSASCKSLVSALENARNKPRKEVTLQKKHVIVKGDQIKKLFGD
jgi:hypothetical protein